ncbi:MAG: hypothetical protein S4CHLAM7_12900 [Chlamydiae bacterium]|nr:hypothetical protein [Chlamydiota bacterium]
MSLKSNSYFLIVALLFLHTSLQSQNRALSDYIVTFNDHITQQQQLSYTGFYERGSAGIHEISLYYSSTKLLSLDQARTLVVEFINEFLSGLNQSARLKSQLQPYPFTEKGLDIVIFFRNDRGGYAPSPYIGQVSIQKGIVTYSKFIRGQFEVIKQENFSFSEKAIAKLEACYQWNMN